MPCCPSVESLTQHLPGASLHHTAAGIFDLPYMTIEEAVQVAFPPSQPYVTPLALPPAMDPLYARPVCNYDPPEQKHELAKSVAQCRQALYKMKAESHATPGHDNSGSRSSQLHAAVFSQHTRATPLGRDHRAFLGYGVVRWEAWTHQDRRQGLVCFLRRRDGRPCESTHGSAHDPSVGQARG